MPRNDVIEFEDLHGNPDNEGRELEVDLDSGKGDGIRKARLDDEPGPRGKTPPDDDFDDLHGNRTDDDRSGERQDRGRNGNSFEARLEREREARKRERERADAAERRAAEAEALLKKQRKAQSEETVQQLDAQIADVEAQLEAALEAEDSKQQVKLTSKLTDLKARRIATEYVQADDEPAAGSGADGRGDRTPQKNELVDKFTDQHADWFKRPGFERQTRLLYRLDKEVHADGYDPMDPEYFEELNRRLREKAPEVFDDEGDAGDGGDDRRGRARAQDGERRRSAVAGSDRDVDGRFAGRRSDPNKVRLTAEDFANMRNFGLDPNDPEVIKEYARNKRQLAAEGAR